MSDFNVVTAAGYSDAGTGLLGITAADANVGEVVQLCIQGVVTNTNWNWSAPGIPLFVDTGGVLVTIDPIAWY